MTNQSRDLIAFPDTACVMDEATVRQLATMFDRNAVPPLSFMNNNPYESPWQHIIEYRNDPESRNQFSTIKNSVSEIAQGSLAPSEAEETLQSLLYGYWQEMQRHHLYIEMKWMEVFVVTTSDVAEKFETSAPRTAGQSWVLIEPRRVALLEGESTMPGSEVAYVIDSKSPFSLP